MSNKVYVIQPSNLSYNLRQPTRQTASYPHVAKPTQMVTVVKNKIPQYNDFEDDTIDSDFIDMDSPQQKQPRRRERLNHLSQEEKLNRRKMKNREAAQNARDRKKEQGKKMEHTVRQLMNENRRLKAENAKLRAAMSRLNGADCQQQTMPPQEQYIPTETHSLAPTTLSVNSSSPLSTVESAVDSGYEEFYQSPSLPSECVEVYTTNEASNQQVEENYNYQQTEEWSTAEFDQNVYVPNAPVQQQQFVSNTIQPQQQQFIDDRAIQTYDDLVKSPFVDELCLELDQWNNDPCFVQEMEAEKAAILNAQEYNLPANEMIDDIDLFEFCDF